MSSPTSVTDDSNIKSGGAAIATAAGINGIVEKPAATTERKYKPGTECVFISDTGVTDPYGASAVPIYQTATFKQTSATSMGDFDYTRSGNPTRSNLESHLCKIIKGSCRAYATSSGMAALDTITRLVSSGQQIVAGDDLYGGTNRLLTQIASNHSIKVHHVDTTIASEVAAVLDPLKTRLVLLETPTNPCIKIADIAEISDVVHSRCPNALVVVDNTMMSPLLLSSLLLGADIEYHSGTKFLSGHHDLMAGVVAIKDKAVADKIYFSINAVGNGLSPFDSFLLLRGIKTLSLRVERQCHNAMVIAEYLVSRGFNVNYPGLTSHPQHELHVKMAKGFGSVMSFTTGDVQKSIRIVETARLWTISVSFGCVNSLISMPCNMSHASIPAHVRAARGMPEDLIRLCVGIEDVDDLIDDLAAAIDASLV